jgi:hypothetical protein
VRGLDPPRGFLGSSRRSEQPETRRARPRHAREQAIRGALQRLQHVRDHRLHPDRRGLQIVAPRGQQRHQ